MATKRKPSKKATKTTSEFPVKFGRLTAALQVFKVKRGTTIEAFCAVAGINYSASIRVNGETVTKDTLLHANDIITAIDAVNGGR